MAFDPIEEDCMRLVLGALRREQTPPHEMTAAADRLSDTFRADPAHLITCDRERSFHLTSQAVETVDYRLPFIVDDAEADKQSESAERRLREAVELDEDNWDARRMLAALDAESGDAYLAYLLETLPAVEASCVEAAARAQDVYALAYGENLELRPYLRWQSAIAASALIAGKYRLALSCARTVLERAPYDPGDIYRTALLAASKLELPLDELKRFERPHDAQAPASRRRPRRREATACAWTLIAEMNLAYRALDYDTAGERLRQLVRAYPDAARILFFQVEFPEGVWARVHVAPGSADELALAVSEATPLLQEGMGTPDYASFSTWIAEHDIVQRELTEADRRQAGAGRAPRPKGGRS